MQKRKDELQRQITLYKKAGIPEKLNGDVIIESIHGSAKNRICYDVLGHLSFHEQNDVAEAANKKSRELIAKRKKEEHQHIRQLEAELAEIIREEQNER